MGRCYNFGLFWLGVFYVQHTAIGIDPETKVTVTPVAFTEHASPVAYTLRWLDPDRVREALSRLIVVVRVEADAGRARRESDGTLPRLHVCCNK